MNTGKKIILPGAVIVSAFLGVAGTSLLNSLQAGAATDTSSSTTSPATSSSGTPATAPDPSFGGHTANGKTEELLTGDVAAKVKAAALAALPGGTVERVETDAEGAAYEAHMKKSDGTRVTLKFDSSYKVTSTEDGPGQRQ